MDLPAHATGVKLEDDEYVVDVVKRWWKALPVEYMVTLGLFHFWQQRGWLILTNKRVIMRIGVFNVITRALPIESVQDATVRVTPLSEGIVVITSAGGPAGSISMAKLEGVRARGFVEAVQAQKSASRRPAAAHPAPQHAPPQERLTQLQEMLDAGAIDQSEYIELRSKILASI